MSEIRKIRIKDVDYDIKSKITISTANPDSDFLVSEPLGFGTLPNGKQQIHLSIGTSLINKNHELHVRVSENGGIKINDLENNGLALNVNNLNLEILENKLQIKEDAYIKCNDGNHVPLRHPDLSTQPSILPYRFMGQYVYEQLIPTPQEGILYVSGNDLIVRKPLFLEACIFGKYGYSTCEVIQDTEGLFGISPKTTNAPSSDHYQYYKIVYTSMPGEGEYYYNESVGLFDKYVELYGESNFIIKQGVNFNCAQPDIYNGDESAYAYPAGGNDYNVFTFTLTEDYLNRGIVGINCYIETMFYADIYILNELITTFELSANKYIELNGNKYRDAVLNKQLRIVVRAQ